MMMSIMNVIWCLYNVIEDIGDLAMIHLLILLLFVRCYQSCFCWNLILGEIDLMHCSNTNWTASCWIRLGFCIWVSDDHCWELLALAGTCWWLLLVTKWLAYLFAGNKHENAGSEFVKWENLLAVKRFFAGSKLTPSNCQRLKCKPVLK